MAKIKYTDVSLGLRNKIRRDMTMTADVYGSDYRGILEFGEDEKELHDECCVWLGIINTYFKTSYDCYKITKVGRFRGIRPINTLSPNKIEFEVDDFDPASWKDWFEDPDGKGDGVLMGSIGTVINQRTFPQYYVDGKYIFAKE